MKRGKPQQQIYRPGSGPLRKSTPNIEETESDTNLLIGNKQDNYRSAQNRYKSEGSSPRDRLHDIDSTTERIGDMTIKDNTRKTRKPEKEIYVPRPLAQALVETHEKSFQHVNGNNPEGGKSKRYSNRRRPNDGREDEWRPSSPFHPSNRGARQGSEPRAASHQSGWQRSRDTRSMEPSSAGNRNYNSDKINNKPPSGRRHSATGMFNMEQLEQLPPRLKKKYLEEHNIKLARQEESWDGCSMTFQVTLNYRLIRFFKVRDVIVLWPYMFEIIICSCLHFSFVFE